MALNYKSSLVRYRRYLAAAEADPVWRASAFVILSLLLLLFMILFAIRPTVITIAELVSQIQIQTELSQKLATKIENVRDASEILSQQRDNLPLLDQAIPKKPIWQEWINSIEKLATASGLVIKSVDAGPINILGKPVVVATINNAVTTAEAPVVPKGVTPINFTIVAEGDYLQVKQFVENFEKLRRLTIVSDIQIAKNKLGVIETTIKGAIGYMPSLTEK